MACDNYYLGTQLPSLLGWNLDCFGSAEEVGLLFLNDHISSGLRSPVSPPDLSTGYLQDAVAEWGDRCKRRRILLFPNHPSAAAAAAEEKDEHHLQGFWNSNCGGDGPFASLNCSTEDKITIPDEALNYSILLKNATNPDEIEHLSSSSSSSYKGPAASSDHRPTLTLLSPEESGGGGGGRKKKAAAAAVTRVVYPFAVVKPGGAEGEVTLKDINRRLLMRPMRPVRHPVGEFACVPRISGNGPGLSGKAVVGFTRIHTQGNGTITIIRTKG